MEAENNKNKGVSPSSYEKGVEAHVGSSGGSSLIGKKFVTNMKTLKKRIVKTHESDSKVDEDWVTFMNLRGWKIKSEGC